MKKELLLATTIAGVALGATSASAVTSSMSGNHRVGLLDVDKDSSNATTGTTNTDIESSFSVSLEETMDSGTVISGSFSMMSESAAFNYTGASGITLAFTDGSSLDLISGGDAHKSHDVAVPGASGEMSIATGSSNSAKNGIDGVGGSNGVGFEWHSADDVAGVEGMSVSFSYSNGDETATSGATVAIDSSISAGVTYVTTTGDTTVTIGAGIHEANDNNSTTITETSVFHIGAVAVNGDLTFGAGVGSGEFGHDTAGDHQEVSDWQSTEIGISYVSGDFTLTASSVDSESTDAASGSTPSGSADEVSKQAVSVDYAVASGVTTTVGFLTQTAKDEGTKKDTSSGSSWYIGTNLSF
ncbi:MAG: hypothetical protein CFH22_01077 [Alphaproteobacteria bacterium MarineAlpha5_Bin12]|nr:MAG: hypothetical protein CFH22_01077 [Alphaproteobacteria bacterium MarineAlpha5_Bin12]|tara:strand:- start:2700 stop:3767 length:1068 start_codon:yes stop_codon:yes gene_type:complete